MGKPIPNRRHETDTLPGEVKTYRLTPEEIANLTPAKPIPPSMTKPIAIGQLSDSDKRKRRGFAKKDANE